MTSLGDAAQTRLVLEQAIEATIVKLRETERPTMEVPAWAKWLAGIGATLLTALITGMAYWMVGTLSEVQLSVREINTQLSTKGAIEQRFTEIDRRVSALESYHSEGKQ